MKWWKYKICSETNKTKKVKKKKIPNLTYFWNLFWTTNLWTSSSWTNSLDLHKRPTYLNPSPPRSPRYLNLTLSCCCHCIPQKTSWKLVFGNRLANTLSCLLQATKALLGRPALSPEPSRPPLCSRTQRGRKSRSVFASHVGTQALYTLQWHCRYFVSLTNRGEACKGCKKKFL